MRVWLSLLIVLLLPGCWAATKITPAASSVSRTESSTGEMGGGETWIIEIDPPAVPATQPSEGTR